MQDNLLVKLSKEFSVKMIKICSDINQNKISDILILQIIRSSTSVGANIHEGNYASSKADFINKFQIALKECYETSYWLDIMKDSGFITQEVFNELSGDCCKLRRMLAASIKTAKNK
jgi:four helix bundle protein